MQYTAVCVKVRRWQIYVRQSLPDEIPAIPTITLQDLPPENRPVVKDLYHIRNWEFCSNNSCRRPGTEFKMMKCAGCGFIPGHLTIYCSRKCQRDAWPEHKRYCRDAAIASGKQALKSGVDVRIWGNCNIMAARRKEGLKLISAWAFDQIIRVHPNINLRETCLSLYCTSSKLGKSTVFPVSYKLDPMAKSPFGLPPPHVFTQYPGRRIGVVQLIVDRVYHEPDYVDLNTYKREITPQTEHWPWILATVVATRTYNAHLANYRMQQLCTVVNALTNSKKKAVLHFRAPTNLDNGEVWHLYDFDEWQRLFGDVIGF